MSVYIPAPLIGVVISTLLSSTLLSEKGLVRISDKSVSTCSFLIHAMVRFGELPQSLLVVTPPQLPEATLPVVLDCLWRISGVVFVCSVESLLCSRMADRLANNRGMLYMYSCRTYGPAQECPSIQTRSSGDKDVST